MSTQGSDSARGPGTLAALVMFAVAGLALLAVGESIMVWVDTEENTRRTGDLLESVRDAVEHLASNNRP